MSQHKLSLSSAILINLNVMIGFGIFVNTVKLAQLAGFLGFLAYVVVAVLIMPLINSVGALMARHTGGFYEYGASINPLAGFLSAWIYFTGKLASAALIVHVVVTMLQQLIPLLATIHTLALDAIILLIFAYLNTLHMRVGGQIVGAFFVLKMMPVLFVILSGLYCISSTSIPAGSALWPGIPLSIPFALYAFTGFETACSLSRSIVDAERNGPRAIYISFILAFIINVLYQLLFFTSTDGAIMAQSNYLNAYPTLFSSFFSHSPQFAQHATNIVHLAIATSALGGSYGILFSNPWNLYILAENGHTFGRKLLTKLNAYGMPVACVIAETILCILYLIVTGGEQTALQQVNALACTIAYTISVLALWRAMCRNHQEFNASSRRMIWFALASCAIFIASCIRNFVIFGIGPLLAFSVLTGLGLLMYASTTSRVEKTI